MDYHNTTNNIEKKIAELETKSNKLWRMVEAEVIAQLEYEKDLAVTILKIRHNEPLELEGRKVEKLPATLTKPVAEALCNESRFKAELASRKVKALIKKLDICMAQLNGWQSINKYVEPQ